MAGSSTADVKLFGPVQAYVAPELLEPPLRFMVVITQVKVPPCAVALGGVMFWPTVTCVVAVQPLMVVAVRVYTPGSITEGSSLVLANPLGPAQDKLCTAEVVVVTVVWILTEVAEQVRMSGAVAASEAVTKSKATVALAVLIQPFGPVTVTV